MVRYALVALVLTAPFTWSFLTIVGGFLVRPFDVLGALLAAYVAFRGRLQVNAFFLAYIGLFVALLVWMGLGVVLSPIPHSLTPMLKMTFYLFVFIALAQAIQQHLDADWHKPFLVSGLVFVLYVLAFRFEVVTAMIEAAQVFLSNPARAIFTFWNSLFQINLFGPSGRIEINGVSFRNTAALGFLTIGLAAYAFVQNPRARTIWVMSMLAIVVFIQSRTAIICAGVFVLMLIGASRNIGGKIQALLIIGATAFVSLNEIILSNTLRRFTSGSGGRGWMNLEGIDMMGQVPVFGLGVNAVVAHTTADRNVHNVPIALGAEFGAPAFLIAGTILLLNLIAGIYFLRRYFSATDDDAKRKFTAFTTAALVVALRPHLSASADNFYSIAEWVCFALVIAGMSYRRTAPTNANGRSTSAHPLPTAQLEERVA